MATAIDVSALWDSCIASLIPASSSSAGASLEDGLSATADAWETAAAFLAPKVLEDSAAELSPTENVVRAVGILQEVDMVGDLLKWHTNQVSEAFKTIIPSELEHNLHNIQTLLLRLATYLQVWSQPYDALSGHVSSSSSSPPPAFTFRKHFLAHLYPLLTTAQFFDSLKAFFQSTMNIAEMEEDEQATSFNVLRAIHYLSFLERFEPLLLGIVYSAIEDRISSMHAGDFETENQLQSIGEWLTNDIASWLVSIYTLAYTESSQNVNDEQARLQAIKSLRPTMQRFEWHIYSELFKLRTSELFDIIVDYPSSEPAIADLKICLEKTDQKAILIRSLTRQVKKRLLHPGADSRDILTQYISLIRVLRILDPPGVLMAKIAGGMRAYLRGREDTIRCIVSGMIEEDSELMNELRGGGGGESASSAMEAARQLTEKQEEQAEDYTDENYSYVPAPIDAPIDYSRNKTADIIQLLVSIYDTKELFVKELQTLLADRLLQIKDYAFERELRNVEVLKIRFGEQALAGLEVMLKDLADSKRTDVALHNTAGAMTNSPVHSTIISHLFWPEFSKTSIKLPGQLGRLASSYEAAYRKVKPEKKLSWIPSLGSVSLEIELKDRKVEVEVCVVQAAVLELFAETSERTLKNVQETLRLADQNVARAALHFWQSKGVLACLAADADEEDLNWVTLENVPEEMQGTATAVEQAGSNEVIPAPKVAPHLPSLSTSIPASISSTTPIQNHWPWIQNALTNLGALPSVRLQNMMNALVPGYVGHTLSELEAFLESARSEGVVVKGKDGLWKLVVQ